MDKKDFSIGFFAACAITLKNHDIPTIIRETIECNFMTVAQMKKIGVDDFDIKILKPVIKEIQARRKENKTTHDEKEKGQF